MQQNKTERFRSANYARQDLKSVQATNIVKSLSSDILELDLSYNQINDKDGIKDLIQTINSTNIVSINLFFNNIGDLEAEALAEALKNTNVLYLDLRNNNIKAKGMKCLLSALNETNLISLHLENNYLDFHRDLEEKFKNILESNRQRLFMSPYLLLLLSKLPEAEINKHKNLTEDCNQSLEFGGGIFLALPTELQNKTLEYLPYMQSQSQKYRRIANDFHSDVLEIGYVEKDNSWRDFFYSIFS